MNWKEILLVEDNPDDVALTLRAFKRQNISNSVAVARDGEEALKMLLGTDGVPPASLPTLVLLDLKLPKVSGLEVLRKIRANPSTAYIPVVVLTSSREERDLVESYGLGCNGYVRKPVDFVEFTEAAKSIGLFWLLLNESPSP